MKVQICIITLCVEDLDRALKFYRDGLGIEGKITQGEGHIAIEPENGVPISLFLREEFQKFAGFSGDSQFARTCISHAAANREEVDDILDKAKNAGGTLTGVPKDYDWGYSGYFKDLDGHLWEIVHFKE
ncbi:MAG: VOC family protein [Firmicutes bacterium]|nr:VOC family protein [Dethiobacter sp.]MBS3888226.1 VOC family protein [Bacillota bacterium]MBS4054004.1 VOC family protein [Thermaerobacter sp.]